MANQLSRKTIKIELEFAVEMSEVSDEHLANSLPKATLAPLKKIQQALLANERALQQIILQNIFIKLQEYSDYLAAQDLTDSVSLGSGQAEVDVYQEQLVPEIDTTEFTRPLRTSCLLVQLKESTIQEKVDSPDCKAGWLPIWRDLRPETEFGRLLDACGVPLSPIRWSQIQQHRHYLMVRYITQQPDGTHIAGRCSCDRALEGIGNDDCQAFDALWASYQQHTSSANVAYRMDQSAKQLFLDD